MREVQIFLGLDRRRIEDHHQPRFGRKLRHDVTLESSEICVVISLLSKHDMNHQIFKVSSFFSLPDHNFLLENNLEFCQVWRSWKIPTKRHLNKIKSDNFFVKTEVVNVKINTGFIHKILNYETHSWLLKFSLCYIFLHSIMQNYRFTEIIFLPNTHQ